MTKKSDLSSGKRRRKLFTFVWIVGLIGLTMSLIYLEQIAVLYILATLGVTALLVVVALADLGGETGASSETNKVSDAQAASSGIKSAYKPNQPSSWGARKT